VPLPSSPLLSDKNTFTMWRLWWVFGPLALSASVAVWMLAWVTRLMGRDTNYSTSDLPSLCVKDLPFVCINKLHFATLILLAIGVLGFMVVKLVLSPVRPDDVILVKRLQLLDDEGNSSVILQASKDPGSMAGLIVSHGDRGEVYLRLQDTDGDERTITSDRET
jgi:hypothetical protein